MLVIPAYYLGVKGEHFIDFMDRVDPLTNHYASHYDTQLINLLSGKENIIILDDIHWDMHFLN